jgi:hypothetical protein
MKCRKRTVIVGEMGRDNTCRIFDRLIGKELNPFSAHPFSVLLW